MTLPRDVISVASSTAYCSRSLFSACGSAEVSSAVAIESAFLPSSFNELSSAPCASVRPDSRALSTRTSNQDSIDFWRNWNDTAYIRPPVMIAINEKTATSRSVSVEPKTRAFSFRYSTTYW